MIRLYGQNRRVTTSAIDEMQISVIVNHLYGSDGMARLQGGSDFDTAYTVPLSRDLRLRFRLNATPTSTAMRGGVNVVLRPIADMPPSLEAQGVESMILDHYCPREGMILVSGGTGSGKSTLIAGLVKAKLEDPEGHYDIVEAAAPVEFLLEQVRGPNSSMNQTEVPRDLPTFAAFVRGAMRREPTDIIVGECRDAETMGASVQAAISGHTLTTTVHASNAPLTMQRIASLCPADERDNLVSAIAQSLRLIVNQRLLRSTDGKRTAIREILVFDAPLRERLLRTTPADWPGLTQRAVDEHGIPFRSSIERALREGRITEAVATHELRQLGRSMWRNTGHPARLLMLDARACLPILIVTVYWSWPTLYLALFGVAFFGTISFFGLTVPAMVRLLRRLLVGPVRTAVPVWKRRRFA